MSRASIAKNPDAAARVLGISPETIGRYVEYQTSKALSRSIERAYRAGITLKFLAALDSLEVPRCSCKLSLTPLCLLRVQPGCRERLRSGSCPCRPRFAPVCQLDHPGGCAKRRCGKRCRCELMEMPECLSPGCPQRRRGRMCDCPRWPGDPCRHIVGLGARLLFEEARKRVEKTARGGADPDSVWCFLLYTLWPKKYEGPTELGAPENLIDRETRVAQMEARHDYFLQLWHPQDVRYAAGEVASALRIDRREIETAQLTHNLSTFQNLLASTSLHEKSHATSA